MKRIAKGAAVIAASLAAATAFAAEPFGADVWLASPQLCREAKAAGSLRKALDDGNLVLTAKGLTGSDFRCHFVQLLKAPDLEAWVATALCRQQGAGDFPNMYSISKGADGRLTLVTVYDDEEPASDTLDGGDQAVPLQSDPAMPATGSQPDAGSGAAAAEAQTGDAPESAGDAAATPDDAATGDVYSRCEGLTSP